MSILNCSLMACLLVVQQVSAISPKMRVLRTFQAENLLLNPGFEEVQEDELLHWSPWREGYEVRKGEGRQGSNALFCLAPRSSSLGAGQTLQLDQSSPVPLMVRGWSRAHDVSGGRDSGYSLYVDVIYQDGTPLWGQHASFDTGSHDWQEQMLTIFPQKPIQRISVYALFRGHAGEVWFDDLEVQQIGGQRIATFDGVPLLVEEQPGREETMIPRKSDKSWAFAYDETSGTVTELRAEGVNLLEPSTPSGFLARDVAADSDFYGFEQGRCEPLALRIQVQTEVVGEGVQIRGRVTSTDVRDRAVTLLFALPVDARGWRWGDDVRHSREIVEPQVYLNAVNIGTGATGAMSLYPWGAITNEQAGLALGLDMGTPGQYRIGYNAGTHQFFIAYDFGLSPDTLNFPNSAAFSFVVYPIDPHWGFRSATERYYQLFPEHFVRRSQDQGIWMPFTDVSTVEGWEDFGFKYHEGINNVAFDDEAGILSFRYTEPSTWWMRMRPEIPRTHAGVMQALEEALQSENASIRRAAESLQVSGSYDAQGRLQYLIRNTPWCDGAVFSLNPSPYLPGNSEAKNSWNEAIQERLYGPDAPGEQDGEYLDSLEGYVTANENFRRDHFRYLTLPLTFSTSSKQPVIHKIFSVYEFTRWISEDLHAMGKLLFANSVPHRFAFLCPWIDVLGTETNWVPNGQWRPPEDSWMNFKRAMCYQKPYLFLMNTRYDQFPPELVERYFQRCLFYGMYPSMFSHNASEDPYWRNPAWYNRDRHLFKQYIPIIKQVAEAGWEPIPHARADNPQVLIERFGPDSTGHLYLTFLNDSEAPQPAAVQIDRQALGVPSDATVQPLRGEGADVVHLEGSSIALSLAPEQVVVIRLPGGAVTR